MAKRTKPPLKTEVNQVVKNTLANLRFKQITLNNTITPVTAVLRIDASKNLPTLCHRFVSLVVYSFKCMKQLFDLTSQEYIHTLQSKPGIGSRLNCFDEAENLVGRPEHR